VHRANIAFETSFPVPWRQPQVSNTMGEKSHTHPPARVGAFPTLLLPFSFKKVAELPRRGLPATGFWWTIVSFTARSSIPSHAFSKMSAWLRPFPAMSYSRSCGTRDWVRTWKRKVCVPSCLSPNPDFLHETAWSPKTSTGPPHKGHGLPAQSASSTGTPRCHLSSVE